MNNQTNMMHKWEIGTNLKAPFKLIGFFKLPSALSAEHNPGAYQNAMNEMPKNCRIGTCEICNASLINNYIIEDSTGYYFSVGCDCVLKSGPKNVISEVKAKKLQLDRKDRAAKREAVYQERLVNERLANGGLTNYEVYQNRQEQLANESAQETQERVTRYAEFAESLADGKGRFRDSIAMELRVGKLPRGRGLPITLDILAKLKGKEGSPSYKIEYARIKEQLV